MNSVPSDAPPAAPRKNIVRQATRRIAAALVVFVVVISGFTAWNQLRAQDEALAAEMELTVHFYQQRMTALERDWEVRAIQFKARVEYGRILENPKIRWSELNSLITSLDDTGDFQHILAACQKGEVLFRHKGGLPALRDVVALNAPIGWYFDEATGLLYRYYVQPVWLGGEEGMGRLILFKAMDNALLLNNALPQTELLLTWSGRVAASSLGGGMGPPPAKGNDLVIHGVRYRRGGATWGDAATGAVPELVILHQAESFAFSLREMGVAWIGAFTALALAMYLFLGSWLLSISRRVTLLGRVATEFAEGLRFTPAIRLDLEEIHRPGGDEITAVAGALGSLTGAVIQREAQRQASQAQLMESESLFRTTFEAAAHGMALASPQGRLLRVNAALCDMLGYAELELLNLDFASLTHPDDLAQDLDLAGRLLAGEIVAYQLEKRYLHRDGGEVWCALSVSLVRDEAGRPVHLVKQIQDVTERRRLERELLRIMEELQRSNEELERFAYVASHDLKEPLRKIISFGNLLEEDYADLLEGEGRDYLERMKNAALRMQRLIDDLLNYSRVSTRAQPFVPLALDQVMQEALIMVDDRLRASGGTVSVSPLPQIHADPTQMGQLFQNLLSNGLKFHTIERPPRVTVSVRPLPPDRVEILFSDNGIGFDEKYLDKIFQPFERLHGRESYEGTGMGLAICQRIVHRHGGTLTARSRPGEGAQFVVTLPLVPPRAREIAAAEESDHGRA
ncbi:MAG: PAS domain S-box protein [Magnetococcales bacterium]|nr:PAS domain S-box protein [Magnetococcales bacterium]